MSKRDRIELELLELEKKEKHQEKIKSLFKLADSKQKEKNKHFTSNDLIPFNQFEEIRNRYEWIRKSYNKDRQKEEFIKFIYFKYQMPIWALNYILKLDKKRNEDLNNKYMIANYKNEKLMEQINKNIVMDLNNDNNIANVSNYDLLLATMNGKGFKGILSHILTNKEIHYFLNSKEDSVNMALMEAKLKPYNLKINKYQFLLNRFDGNNLFKNDNNNPLKDLFFFLAKNDIDKDSCQEIYDYFVTLTNNRYLDGSITFEDKKISTKDFFKKSLNTIIQLSNDFHIQVVNLKNNKLVEWNKTFENFEFDKFLFKELTSNKDLSKEGQVMRHCVGSYSERCLNGRVKIVSLNHNIDSKFEKLVTIEITDKRIVQARGKCNRKITEQEYKAISEFAAYNKLNMVI